MNRKVTAIYHNEDYNEYLIDGETGEIILIIDKHHGQDIWTVIKFCEKMGISVEAKSISNILGFDIWDSDTDEFFNEAPFYEDVLKELGLDKQLKKV